MTDRPDSRDVTRASFEEAVAVRDRIYQLRGQILSDVSAVEGGIEMALCCYFISSERSQHFYRWMAVRLSLSDKIEILEKIVDEIGVKGRVADTMSRLAQATTIRNHLAHSNLMVTPPERIGPMGLTFEVRSLHRTKRGMRFARVEIEELERSAALIEGLAKEAGRVVMAIVAAATGKDPMAEMDAYDAEHGQTNA